MRVLREFGQNVKVFSFEGTKKGETSGFPKTVETYNTVAHGTLERFMIGEREVIEDGKKFVLVAEEYTPGNAYVPGRYIAIYAAAEIAADVIRKLNEYAFTFEMPAMIAENKTVETRYHAALYTVIWNASKTGIIRDDLSDNIYRFAGVLNGKVVTEWHTSVNVAMELLAKRAIDSF